MEYKTALICILLFLLIPNRNNNENNKDRIKPEPILKRIRAYQ